MTTYGTTRRRAMTRLAMLGWLLGAAAMMFSGAGPAAAADADEQTADAAVKEEVAKEEEKKNGPENEKAADADGDDAGENDDADADEAAPPPPPSAEELAAALQTLRDLSANAPEDRSTVIEDPVIRDAWRLVVHADEIGADAIMKTLPDLKPVGEGDDIYRLMVGGMLWQTSGPERVDAIIALWSDPSLVLSLAPRLVFGTAFQAARTGDERVLPLLALVFRDRDGVVHFRRRDLDYSWPETHEFLWAAYGPGGQDALFQWLEATRAEDGDPDFITSAAWLLARDAYLPVLPVLRELAADERADLSAARYAAVRGLGIFGHPDDFDKLVALLKKAAAAKDEPLIDAALDALGEFGDLRASAEFISLILESGAPDACRARAIALLVNLLTPEGLAMLRLTNDDLDDYPEAAAAAAKAAAAVEGGGEEAGEVRDTNDLAAAVFDALDLTAEAYDAMSPEEQTAEIARWRGIVQDEYEGDAFDPEGKMFTRAQFDEVMAVLAYTGAFPVEGFDWVHPRHLLSVATVDDVDVLLSARRAAARPLSESSLSNVDVFSAMVTRLVRKTYRLQPGFTDVVTPVPAPKAAAAEEKEKAAE